MSEVINGLVREIAQTKADADAIKVRQRVLEESLLKEVGDSVREQLKDADYGCGTANVEGEYYKIKVEVKKKVTWEQDKLQEVCQLLTSRGEDPKEYMKMKLDIEESKYKNWPASLQQLFVEARTVEPSKPTISIENVSNEKRSD